MAVLLVLPILIHGLSVEKIPTTKSPPKSTIMSSAVYDPLFNRIITIGGSDAMTGDQSPNIYSFDLEKKSMRRFISFKIMNLKPMQLIRCFYEMIEKFYSLGLAQE